MTSAPTICEPSASGGDDETAIAFAEIAALTMLDAIGRKITRTLPRSERAPLGRARITDTFERHTVIPVAPAQVPALVASASRLVTLVAPDLACLHGTVREYVSRLVLAGKPHQQAELAGAIRRAGCLDPG